MTRAVFTRAFSSSPGGSSFEHHWGEKIAWFLHEALPNALSMFVLNDNNHRDQWLVFRLRAAGGRVAAWPARVVEWRRHGRARGFIWLSALLGPAGVRLQRQLGRLRAIRDLPDLARDDCGAAVFPGGSLGALTEQLGRRQRAAARLDRARRSPSSPPSTTPMR